MNGYVCFYRGKRWETHAETSYKAQQNAAKHFKTKKPWLITVVLAELDGQQVTHKPVD